MRDICSALIISFLIILFVVLVYNPKQSEHKRYRIMPSDIGNSWARFENFLDESEENLPKPADPLEIEWTEPDLSVSENLNKYYQPALDTYTPYQKAFPEFLMGISDIESDSNDSNKSSDLDKCHEDLDKLKKEKHDAITDNEVLKNKISGMIALSVERDGTTVENFYDNAKDHEGLEYIKSDSVKSLVNNVLDFVVDNGKLATAKLLHTLKRITEDFEDTNTLNSILSKIAIEKKTGEESSAETPETPETSEERRNRLLAKYF